MTTAEMSPTKEQARRVMERLLERIGERYHALVDSDVRSAIAKADLLRERDELAVIWRLAGFGELPVFEPTASAEDRLRVKSA